MEEKKKDLKLLKGLLTECRQHSSIQNFMPQAKVELSQPGFLLIPVRTSDDRLSPTSYLKNLK